MKKALFKTKTQWRVINAKEQAPKLAEQDYRTLIPLLYSLDQATDGIRGCSTYRAALQCVSSGGVLGLQISGKSCHSICDKKRFDKIIQPSSQFELHWMHSPNWITNT